LNNTDSVVAFWTMTCDWQSSFLINNSYITFLLGACDSNYPHQVKIKAHDSIQIKTTLVRNIEYDNPCKGCVGCWADQGHVQTTKIGLIFVDSSCKNIQDYDNWISDKSRWNIVWSNPLNLENKCYTQHSICSIGVSEVCQAQHSLARFLSVDREASTKSPT